MTELIEEPQFKIYACVGNYVRKKSYQPNAAIITEESHDYLERANLLYTSNKTTFLANSWRIPIRVYKIEELSQRKRAKLGATKGLILYLGQTGFFGGIKVKSIYNYNLEKTTLDLAKS